MNVRLTYRNNSNDVANASVVIIQKMGNTNDDKTAVAWMVIKNCGRGDYHPFTYPMQMNVACVDNDGNYTPTLPASNGDVFSLSQGESGNQLSRLAGLTGDSCGIEVRNDRNDREIHVCVYKNERLLAVKNNVAPGEKVVFQFSPTIRIGMVPGVEEGDVMGAAAMSDINTELSLQGVASADVVLTGGDNERFSFTLENVKRS